MTHLYTQSATNSARLAELAPQQARAPGRTASHGPPGESHGQAGGRRISQVCNSDATPWPRVLPFQLGVFHVLRSSHCIVYTYGAHRTVGHDGNIRYSQQIVVSSIRAFRIFCNFKNRITSRASSSYQIPVKS